MIGKLTGLVDQVEDDHLLLDVGGVGYLVFCSGRTLAGMPERGGSAGLLIETQVREDRIVLYGFADRGELRPVAPRCDDNRRHRRTAGRRHRRGCPVRPGRAGLSAHGGLHGGDRGAAAAGAGSGSRPAHP